MSHRVSNCVYNFKVSYVVYKATDFSPTHNSLVIATNSMESLPLLVCLVCIEKEDLISFQNGTYESKPNCKK